ncbi:MAG TPA: FecR family protein [Lacipirellulaceae bacterium]|nr:FecR family protein [Lacipirellulaceae bacterium]
MRGLTFAVFVTGAVFSSGVFLLSSAVAQDTNAPAPNQSVHPIGKVVTATGLVTIRHAGAVILQAALGDTSGGAKVGDLIYLGDTVATGADGRVGITFTDGTAFDLSSNANMVMTEFVYDPNSKSNSTLLSLTKGTFTFVAGKVAKTGDMKIDTPVATMGIRGTTPRVEISDDGSVKFSTLIERGKSDVLRRFGGAPNQTNATPPVQERDKPNLEICRGC